MDVVLAGLCVTALFMGAMAGIGGPGGTLMILVLFAATQMSQAGIAGTASTVMVFSNFAAATGYYRSDHIDWSIVAALVPTTLIGSQSGVYISELLSEQLFTVIFGAFLIFVGGNIVYRELKEVEPFNLDTDSWKGKVVLASLGFFVGVAGGIIGMGGPAVSVPALIVIGVPALTAIGSGITQGVFLTISTSTGYIMKGAVEWNMVLVLGIPFVFGMVGGWIISQKVNVDRIKLTLGVLLLLATPLVIL